MPKLIDFNPNVVPLGICDTEPPHPPLKLIIYTGSHTIMNFTTKAHNNFVKIPMHIIIDRYENPNLNQIKV